MQRYAYPLLAFVFAGLALSMLWGTPSPDLTALYVAAHAVAQGQEALLYAADLSAAAPELAELRAGLGLADAPHAPFTYPPLWAWLFAPLAKAFSLAAFANGFLALHVIVLCASVGLAWKVIRPPHIEFGQWLIFAFAVLALSAPVWHALMANQPQILALFLVLLAFERYRAGHFAAAGTVLALAAAFKLAPLFLVLIFVLERNWRAASAFAITGAALAALSLALAGPALHAEFLGTINTIDKAIILAPQNFAPELALFQLSGETAASLTAPEPFWLSSLMAALMLTALAALILMRPRLIAQTAMPVLLLGFTLATALFGPVSWSYLFVLPLLLLPTLFHIMSASSAWRVIWLTLALQSAPLVLFLSSSDGTLYKTTLLGALTYLGLLTLLTGTVLRAVRFEPEVPLHFR